MQTDSVREMRPEEVWALLEENLRKRGIAMSAREFVTAYIAGTLEDPDDVVDLLVLADLLPETKKLFVPT